MKSHNSQERKNIITEVKAFLFYFILCVFSYCMTKLFSRSDFVFLGAICAYEKSCSLSLRSDFQCTANLHLLFFSFPSLCARLPLVFRVRRQSVSRWAVGSVDWESSLWFRVTADTFSEDWEALQDCERSTPVFRCWSWQRARSIMSRGVYTLRPESQTAKSNKSPPNGYWEWLPLLTNNVAMLVPTLTWNGASNERELFQNDGLEKMRVGRTCEWGTNKPSVCELFKCFQNTVRWLVHKELQRAPLNMHLEYHSTDRCRTVRGTWWLLVPQ